MRAPAGGDWVKGMQNAKDEGVRPDWSLARYRLKYRAVSRAAGHPILLCFLQFVPEFPLKVVWRGF